MKQPESLEQKDVDSSLQEGFISQKIGQPKIMMSITDRVQIQSVTAFLSYECTKLRENKVQSAAETD